MLFDIGALILGGAMLYFGAEWLVRGAAGLALKLGVRPLLIGLTVVSYATSAPELVVSVVAARMGDSAIALGNVVGSNIANVALILGLTALISPPRGDGTMAGRELWVLLAATVALPLTLINGWIGRFEGAALFAGAVAFTLLTLRWSKARPVDLDEVPSEERFGKPALIGIGIVGLGVLVAGGQLFVNGAVEIAKVFGMNERVIGLTIVAIGTSLPELAASVVAALRGHSELALGNVVGSNIFNLLLILGVASLVHPIGSSLTAMFLDLPVLGALTLYLVLALRKPRVVTRTEGTLLTLSYVTFLGGLVWLTA